MIPNNLRIVGAIVVSILIIEWDGTSLKPTLTLNEARLGPHLTVLYDGHCSTLRYCVSPRDHPHTFQSS